MMDLKQMYQILDYSYQNRDRAPGESVCIVIVPPAEIANQFPQDGKAEEDNSPPHITVAYLGNVIPQLECKIVEVAKSVCENTRPFWIKLGKVKVFENEEHNVYHSQIKGKKLFSFREMLKQCFSLNQIQIDTKFPEFKPHITIEYVPLEEEAKYAEIKPEGKWLVDSVWLWGMQQPHLLHFK